jgi:chromosome segregation ATPase
VAATLDAHLRAAGLTRCDEPLEALPSDALVLYAPPDGLLAAGMESMTEPPLPPQLIESYKIVHGLCGRHRVLASWRLAGQPPEALRQWLVHGAPLTTPPPAPTPDPLTALVTKALLEAQPQVLEAYLDLELTAELAGGASDTSYRERISQAAADPRRLLRSWWLPHQLGQASLRDKTAQMARADALEGELRQVRTELERRVGEDEEKTLQIEQLRTTLEAENAKVAGLEADLTRTREARDEATQARVAVERERDDLAAEKGAALSGVADLQLQLDAETEARRRAQDREAQLASRVEALEEGNQRAAEETERLLSTIHEQQGEIERRCLADQANTTQIEHLQRSLDGRSAQLAVLEAEREHFSLAHQAALRDRDALARERQLLEEEKLAERATVADLHDQLSERNERLRQARDAEAQLTSRVEALESETQHASQEAEHLLTQLHGLQEELERRFLAEQANAAQIEHLQRTLDARSAQISGLEAERHQLSQALEAALRDRDTLARERQILEEEKLAERATVADLHDQLSAQNVALRLAQVGEAQHRDRSEGLVGENGQLQEEARVLVAQLHHLQEELEKTFLHGQAGNQLIAAQHHQLQRAQSLMSRLLVQATRSAMPTESVAVEVLPPRPARGLLDQGAKRSQGWGTGLMRKIWSR